MRSSILFCLSLIVLLAACAKPAPAYRDEAFTAESPFEYRSTLEPLDNCQVGQRALLSQGYQVEMGRPNSVKGSKFFQPESGHQTELSITLVCLPSGSGGSVLYASAVQSRYELKSASSSAGVSVAGMGSISLPWMANKEAMVKVADETVTDPDFYKRLFALIGNLEGE
ncbi:DUF2242 domain-containing protein [Azovibrio restrictus]|uniref:DUF2242 domain-containing protein n=1 Tax=Azovibrio restrictus TaxID=146938 RepID=UPI000400DCEA|nr:DUF2242 domain-containing protein [Azovibrio restrictus]MCE1172345.1 DUF2242 domain-containing protein [Azovibrio sp.]